MTASYGEPQPAPASYGKPQPAPAGFGSYLFPKHPGQPWQFIDDEPMHTPAKQNCHGCHGQRSAKLLNRRAEPEQFSDYWHFALEEDDGHLMHDQKWNGVHADIG